MRHIIFITSVFLSTSILSVGKTLDIVKKRGHIKCGVSQGLAGFSAPDAKGVWRGLDVEVCQAVAVAVFGDPSKVKYVGLSAQSRFTALQSGEVDILSRNSTWTLSRDTTLGLNFGPVIYYDGQSFMVRKKDNIKDAKNLNGASICTQQGTTTELNMADYFRKNRMKMKPVVFESNDEVTAAFFKGRCDALTTDASGLASERSKIKNPNDYIILPNIISKEPLAPVVRHGDDNWYDILTWSTYALLEAEELGMTSSNVHTFLKSKDPRIKRFLGVTPGNGKSLGLSEKFAFNIIQKIGNYSEVFERNVGQGSPLKLSRGINALWNKGGLMYAPPFR